MITNNTIDDPVLCGTTLVYKKAIKQKKTKHKLSQ